MWTWFWRCQWRKRTRRRKNKWRTEKWDKFVEWDKVLVVLVLMMVVLQKLIKLSSKTYLDFSPNDILGLKTLLNLIQTSKIAHWGSKKEK